MTHICGDPSDPCDAECMERAYVAREMDDMRTTIASLRKRLEEAEKMLAEALGIDSADVSDLLDAALGKEEKP